jgi:hypothetical protein
LKDDTENAAKRRRVDMTQDWTQQLF